MNNEDYKQGRTDAINDCLLILKTAHMMRTYEDDFDSKIEVPFYKELWGSFTKLKETINE